MSVLSKNSCSMTLLSRNWEAIFWLFLFLQKRMNLEKLEEAILLQSEVLDLKANIKRSAKGIVVEAKLEKVEALIATVLIQGGTLKVGDILLREMNGEELEPSLMITVKNHRSLSFHAS